MNQTTYNNRPVRSPVQLHPAELAKKKALDTQNPEHTIRREIRKLCGEYKFTAQFSEDEETLATFQHVPGLIAVQCLLQDKDGRPVGSGHGSAILTRINKSIERTAFICLNAAFLSAANSACKVMDSLRLDAYDQSTPMRPGEAYRTKPEESSNLASDKQKAYLRQLISLNCDESDGEQLMSQIEDLTRQEASGLIQKFSR